jgi:hypothetical protein
LTKKTAGWALPGPDIIRELFKEAENRGKVHSDMIPLGIEKVICRVVHHLTRDANRTSELG